MIDYYRQLVAQRRAKSCPASKKLPEGNESHVTSTAALMSDNYPLL
ncbi:hypothetical protein VRK_42390 [Vibrio sp. MEBiC08052]|nr:hypothetical protein VRK_42390 [Vibrio sp. MEBiC08052]